MDDFKTLELEAKVNVLMHKPSTLSIALLAGCAAHDLSIDVPALCAGGYEASGKEMNELLAVALLGDDESRLRATAELRDAVRDMLFAREAKA